MDLVAALLIPIWLMIPALVPNSAAVLFGGGTPMDLGRSWRGRRVLGDGKTWRGFFGGALSGVLVGGLQLCVSSPFSPDFFGFGGSLTGAMSVIAALAFGSMLGDSFGAFVKRRLGMERGEKAVGLDQYNFVIGALVLLLVVDLTWFFDRLIAGYHWIGLALFLLLVPLIHRGVNIIGYKMGKKDVPW